MNSEPIIRESPGFEIMKALVHPIWLAQHLFELFGATDLEGLHVYVGTQVCYLQGCKLYKSISLDILRPGNVLEVTAEQMVFYFLCFLQVVGHGGASRFQLSTDLSDDQL